MTVRSRGDAPRAMHRSGAEIAMTYLNDKARPYVEPLASAVGASLLLPLEVRDTEQINALFEAIALKWGRLDILVTRSRSRRDRRSRGALPTVRATAS